MEFRSSRCELESDGAIFFSLWRYGEDGIADFGVLRLTACGGAPGADFSTTESAEGDKIFFGWRYGLASAGSFGVRSERSVTVAALWSGAVGIVEFGVTDLTAGSADRLWVSSG